MQWGWALLIIGSVLLIVGAAEKHAPTVIASIIIASLISGGMAYFVYDAGVEKARKDCKTIALAVQKYNQVENRELIYLTELSPKYIVNINNIRDFWGNSFQYDNSKKMVYSKGPDLKANTSDDIKAYINKK